ncbi:MAG TPA: hypothetical protein VFS39_12950 [Nitrospira sp.]|nr:hypothetical protein [Nitrospira sp.]
MQVTLDSEHWTVGDDLSLLEVLAQVSDKARGRGRIVTELKIGGRIHTDRDLIPSLLARKGKDAGSVEAVSSTTADLLSGAKDAVSQYGAQLKAEGGRITQVLRTGALALSDLDQWLGQLADYMEITERGAAHRIPGFHSAGLSAWVEHLMDARTHRDCVRMADLLEYELLPRLAS